MRRVVVESPYAGDVAKHVRYARLALRDCLRRGEAPLASHLLYTQEGVLDDNDPAERVVGMSAGWEWLAESQAVVVYTDHGISKGMEQGIRLAQLLDIPVEYRTIAEYAP